MGVNRVLDVRPCTPDDLRALQAAWPTPGSVHEAHYRQQATGATTYLVAWRLATPVGSAVVRWEGFPDAAAAAALPDCVEICHLQVREKFRGQGAGSRLVDAAEALARERGITCAALGVATDSPRTPALYERLGYIATEVVVTSEYDWVDAEGRVRHAVEENRILVKRLDGVTP